jgi:hypothetical protein
MIHAISSEARLGPCITSYDPQLEAEMRKQDRIRQQQDRPERQPEREAQPQQQEQMQGRASADQPQRPQREPGKLPLPD